jgi:hypothetical protein
MTKIIYEIVRHDGGWAFKLDGTLSNTYPNHDAAYNAAKRVALEQMRPGRNRRHFLGRRTRPLAR